MRPGLVALLKQDVVSLRSVLTPSEPALSDTELNEFLIALCDHQPKVLDLSDQKLSVTTAALLPKVLNACPTLIVLDLSDCKLNSSHDSAVEQLASSIARHPALLSVNVSTNAISEKGLGALVRVPQHNGTLWQLNVEGNSFFTQDVAQQAVTALRENTAFVSLRTHLTPFAIDSRAEQTRAQLSSLLLGNQHAFLRTTKATISLDESVVNYLRSFEFRGLVEHLSDTAELGLRPLEFSAQRELENREPNKQMPLMTPQRVQHAQKHKKAKVDAQQPEASRAKPPLTLTF